MAFALHLFLAEHYELLRQSLGKKLGSDEQASDILHDIFVRLQDKPPTGLIKNPRAYITGMAQNMFVDNWRREERYLDREEIDSLLTDGMPGADPQQSWESGAELDALAIIIQGLPPRRRDILLSVRLEGISTLELARRYGISQRMVEKELRRAHEYCVSRRSKR
ncbi:RNA polymerase sigma factor [Sodalis ligni]|jgi:RNA polymerase sigma factor (sigma-70 family)|uniref:RNA polymerase sigma-70 factor (ECF subfamily) n=1 Tax=Sodalis ligni TaxID=2697027 RepID=A0A4V2Q3B7_9GAMM|nr:RNA polymerase sigma factor [Sodalis ligni]TCL06178.1 RNA polymerase sigma-70 factor (ECF subfamily) [Sodalis ligni]